MVFCNGTPFYIPTGNVGRFQFFHIFTNISWPFSWLGSGISLWLWFVLTSWLMMLNIFVCLLANFISSVEKRVFNSFAHFWVGWLSFCCSFVRVPCIVWVSSERWYANIFSYSLRCLFTFLIKYLWFTEVTNFEEAQFIYFFFCCSWLRCHI